MASWNEASIWASSAPKVARKTPRSRCNSAFHSALQIFQPVLPPLLLPRELQGYDPRDAKLQPLVLETMADRSSSRLPASLLFLPRSARCRRLCDRKHCAPNCGEWLLQLATTQNYDALTVQLNPMPSVPLRQHYAQSGPEPRQNTEPGLKRSYHLAPSL